MHTDIGIVVSVSAEQFVGYLREIAESCARRSDSDDALTLISSNAISQAILAVDDRKIVEGSDSPID